MRSSDFLPLITPSSLPSSALTSPAHFVRSRAGRAAPRLSLALSGGLRIRLGTTGPPRFLGNPFVRMPSLDHPGGALGRGHRTSFRHRSYSSPQSLCLRPLGRPRPTQQSRFRGCIHAAYALAVYASQPASRPPTQDSLPAGGTPWPAGTSTRWVTIQGFSSRYVLLVQAYPGAPQRQAQLAARCCACAATAAHAIATPCRSVAACRWAACVECHWQRGLERVR